MISQCTSYLSYTSVFLEKPFFFSRIITLKLIIAFVTWINLVLFIMSTSNKCKHLWQLKNK